MKNLSLVFFFVSSLVLSSCAYIQKLSCNSGVASRNAQSDVKEGRLDQPASKGGDSCEGEYTKSQFVNDYKKAYDEAVRGTCVLENAIKAGATDGDAGLTDKPQIKQFSSCAKMQNQKQLEAGYNKEFIKAYCSDSRGTKMGAEAGSKMEASSFEQKFASCDSSRKNQLITVYDASYKAKYAQAVKEKTEEFVRTNGTSSFVFQGRSYSASCRVAADRGSLQITVANPHPQQALLQGQWKFTYYDKGFQRLMDDTSQEAVLLTNGNPKSFSKMTMPRDAEFCRAEFLGQ